MTLAQERPQDGLESTGTLVSLDCDYLTALSAEGRSKSPLHRLSTEMFRTQRDRGNDVRSWGMSGFSGWKCGDLELGVREDLFMVRMYSDAAAMNWRQILPLADKVTRIDLQATVRVDGSVGERLDTDRVAAIESSQGKKPKPIVQRIDDNRGGYTLYLGARTSNVFGREYNKFAKTKLDHYRSCLRYEVQFNSRLAGRVSNHLLSLASPKEAIAGYISRFFESRGVEPRLPYSTPATYCCSRQRTDSDRKLEWLRSSVRPSVLSLIARGRGAEALAALGLVEGEP